MSGAGDNCLFATDRAIAAWMDATSVYGANDNTTTSNVLVSEEVPLVKVAVKVTVTFSG